MSSRHGTSDELRAVVEALRSHDRFLIVTHENPDGDALGSLLAMKLGLDRLGKDSVTFLPGESGIPSDLSLLNLEGLQRALPPDAAGRVLRAVDGTEMAAMIREPPEPPGSPRRVSLRASHDEIDVSAIARKRGGGGHRQAAGFSSDESIDQIVEFIRSEFVQATRAAARA